MDKKEILRTLTEVNGRLSLISKDISVYHSDYAWVGAFMRGLGYIRDTIMLLNKEIIKDGKL